MKLNRNQIKEHLEILHNHYFFDIELSANCNLNCSFCPREFISRKNMKMTDELMKILVDWLPDKASIMFAGMGEPLLNKNIYNVIDSISNENRITGITTNGQILTPKIIEQIHNSKLEFIQISINKIDDLEYRKISGNYSNKKIITALNLINERNIHKKHELQFSFVSDKLNKNSINEQAKFAKKYSAKYFQKEIHNRGGFLNSKSNKKYNRCYIFSQITFINSDGDILYCCHDLQSKKIIGNIKTHSFKEITKQKEKIIRSNNWLSQCDICDDNGRKNLIK